jgi:uncharacterized membrane protein
MTGRLTAAVAGLIALIIALAPAGPARAAETTVATTAGESEPPRRADLPVWRRTLYKTVTYQAAANAADLLAFELLIGGTAATTAGFLALNAVSAAGLYYGFEYLWQTIGPPLEETTEQTVLEKTVLYRFVNIGRNFAIGYGFGGGAASAAAFGAANLVYDTGIFVTNEYVWDILRPQRSS